MATAGFIPDAPQQHDDFIPDEPKAAPNAGLAPPAGPSRTMDSGEGPIAQNMTSFEAQASRIPGNTVRMIGAKHWPIIDAHNFHELGQDFRSLNPVVTTDKGTPNEHTDWGATAANLAPLAVSGEGIGESPVGRITRGAGSAVSDLAVSPKVGALAKTAATDALSHVPFAGRLVRRPSIGDYISAARTPASALPEELDATGENRPFAGGEDEYKTPPVVPPDYRPGFRAPRSYYGGQPPEPIPPRSGLQLPGQVAAPLEGEYVDSQAAAPGEEAPYAPATVVNPRAPEPAPAPYRRVGGIEPEDVGAPNPNVLARGQGVRVPPRMNRGLALPEAPPVTDPLLERVRGYIANIQARGHGDEVEPEPERTPDSTNLNDDLTPQLKASLKKVMAAKRNGRPRIPIQ